MTSYNHAVFDIETLDTQTSAIVLSCAVVPFNLGDDDGLTADQLFSRARAVRFPIDPQVQLGRTLSQGTLQFWLDQHPLVLELSLKRFPGVQPTPHGLAADLYDKLGLEDIRGADGDRKKACWWANGPHFDMTIFEHFMLTFGAGRPPWAYNRVRDSRTLTAVCREVYPELAGALIDKAWDQMQVLHDPRWDCAVDAWKILRLHRLLKEGR